MKGLTEKQNLLMSINVITGLSGFERVKTEDLRSLLDYIEKDNPPEEPDRMAKYRAMIQESNLLPVIPAISAYRKDHGAGLREARDEMVALRNEIIQDRTT